MPPDESLADNVTLSVQPGDLEFVQLVVQARARHPDASRCLFDQFGALVLYWIRRRLSMPLRTRVVSADIAQEVWLTTFVAIEGGLEFRSPEHFRAYLSGAVFKQISKQIRNHVKIEKRSVTREQPLDAQNQDQGRQARPTEDPAELVAGREEMEHWQRCLPERERALLEGLLGEEKLPAFAERLGLPIEEARLVLQNCWQILREKFPQEN